MTRRSLRSFSRPLVLSAIVIAAFAWDATDGLRTDRVLLLNASPSLPHWAFWLDREAPIARGSLVFFAPPPSRLIESHFGAEPQIFGKRVLGMPGDSVGHKGNDVFINGRKVATRLAATRQGIPLTRGFDGLIPPGCYYVGSDHPRGLDSRYGAIGLVCARQILGSGSAIL